MKTPGNQTSNQSKPKNAPTTRPEIRDNLDSRKNEEQEWKGDDETHNQKENKDSKLKKRKEN